MKQITYLQPLDSTEQQNPKKAKIVPKIETAVLFNKINLASSHIKVGSYKCRGYFYFATMFRVLDVLHLDLTHLAALVNLRYQECVLK